MLRVTTITRCFNTSSSVGTLNVFMPPFFSIKQYWTEDNSHHSHIKTKPVQNTGTVDFRHILKWKSCYSLVFHAIPLISTDFKFKNLNSSLYVCADSTDVIQKKNFNNIFLHTLQTCYSQMEENRLLSSFFLPKVQGTWETCGFHSSHTEDSGLLGCDCVLLGLSPPTFQRNIQY